MNNCKLHLKDYHTTWNSILKMIPDIKNNEIDNTYFNEVPISQEFLTNKGNTIEEMIDYSCYTPINSKTINFSKYKDLFYGILFYIFYYSNNKLNIAEIEFHFSGARIRRSFELMFPNNDYNILNIFDSANINLDYKIDGYKNAFFGVTFKRIKIKPISYSIRSGIVNQNLKSHLISFTFEAYDEENKKWDVLDERVNINSLIPSGGFQMFYVRSAEKYYSSFKIQQTEPGSNGFWGFSISSFDIHGNILINPNSICLDEQNIEENTLFNDEQFDINPTMDMSCFLF